MGRDQPLNLDRVLPLQNRPRPLETCAFERVSASMTKPLIPMTASVHSVFTGRAPHVAMLFGSVPPIRLFSLENHFGHDVRFFEPMLPDPGLPLAVDDANHIWQALGARPAAFLDLDHAEVPSLPDCILDCCAGHPGTGCNGIETEGADLGRLRAPRSVITQ